LTASWRPKFEDGLVIGEDTNAAGPSTFGVLAQPTAKKPAIKLTAKNNDDGHERFHAGNLPDATQNEPWKCAASEISDRFLWLSVFRFDLPAQ